MTVQLSSHRTLPVDDSRTSPFDDELTAADEAYQTAADEAYQRNSSHCVNNPPSLALPVFVGKMPIREVSVEMRLVESVAKERLPLPVDQQEAVDKAEQTLDKRITSLRVQVPENSPIQTERLHPEKISPFDYAFLQIGELRALSKNFNPQNLPRFMEKWGYELNKIPQNGDLVLFLREDVPTHMGIYRAEKNLIESKWDIRADEAYLHRVEDTPSNFGTQVLYYRPPKDLAKLISALEPKIKPFQSSDVEDE